MQLRFIFVDNSQIMKTDLLKTELSFVPFIGKTMKFVEVLINSSFKENGLDLTKNQFILLKHVQERPMPQTSLTLITECNKSSLTRLIHSLEKKDLVKRVTSSEDKRINTIEITSQGKKVFEKAEPILDVSFDKMLNGVNTKEQKMVKQVFEKIMLNTKNEIDKSSVVV